MSPADCFPWGACTSRTMQTDHTRAHAAGGVQQPFPGIYQSDRNLELDPTAWAA